MPKLLNKEPIFKRVDNDLINTNLSIEELVKKYDKPYKYFLGRKQSLKERGKIPYVRKGKSNVPVDFHETKKINLAEGNSNSITINGISIEALSREVWVRQENNRLHIKW
jgi:hypothetical protein